MHTWVIHVISLKQPLYRDRWLVWPHRDCFFPYKNTRKENSMTMSYWSGSGCKHPLRTALSWCLNDSAGGELLARVCRCNYNYSMKQGFQKGQGWKHVCLSKRKRHFHTLRAVFEFMGCLSMFIPRSGYSRARIHLHCRPIESTGTALPDIAASHVNEDSDTSEVSYTHSAKVAVVSRWHNNAHGYTCGFTELMYDAFMQKSPDHSADRHIQSFLKGCMFGYVCKPSHCIELHVH